ncbi:hypothetical protein [Streptomyces sp. NPDC002994]|uniref:hypothetical protein n=1 Tax=Streptomyces sp. NPDC002994 TaxID=3154441 RepID=UPI0033A404F2
MAEQAGGGHSNSDVETEKGSDEGCERDPGSGTADPTSEPTAPTKDTRPSGEPGDEDGHNH